MSLPEETLGTQNRKLDRRHFIKLTALALLAGISPYPVHAGTRGRRSTKRTLVFYNTHTEESLEIVYWAHGRYQSAALGHINYILRDHRNDEIKAIDTRLLDLLYKISLKANTSQPFHIISGYRSSQTNTLLREGTEGVARNSLHIYGKAADVRLPDCSLSFLRKIALNQRCGGVGYYPNSNFIHIDVGRVRCWES